MHDIAADSPDQPVADLRGMVDFIVDLNISRRQVAAYPKGHPLIAAALEKACRRLDPLLAPGGELKVGIARDVLLVDGLTLGGKHPACRDFARGLFSHQVAAVTFRRHLSAEELLLFHGFLGEAPEVIQRRGGLGTVLAGAGIQHLEVLGINYEFFLTTEGVPTAGRNEKGTSNLWEEFVHGLMEGSLDPTGRYIATSAEIDPELLAGIHNRQGAARAQDVQFTEAIAAFLSGVDQKDLESQYDLQAIDKLSAFVHKLKPALRREILKGILDSLGNRRELAQGVLERFPDELVLEILSEINEQESYAPPMILEVLQQLGRHGATGGAVSLVAGVAAEGGPELGDRLQQLFAEDGGREALPDDYRRTLQRLVSVEPLSSMDREGTAGLRDLLVAEPVERAFGAVLVELGRLPLAEGEKEGIRRNLQNLCNHHLGSGNFSALVDIFNRLEGSSLARMVFTDPTFLGEVLQGLDLWGKAKYDGIRDLLRKVGSPFIEPLLERLAEEENMSMRRYLMERLIEQGEALRQAAIAKLFDKRWYFVRNLVIILRGLDDPAILPPLRRLMGHPHIRVRQETLKTFLYFRDPEADRFLLRELDHADPDQRLHAVQAAQLSRSPQVVAKLLALLREGGLAEAEFELKKTAVRTLAEIGDGSALPELERLLAAKTLLRSQILSKLKVEVIRSLERYPGGAARPLLDKLVQFGRGDLAALALEVRRNLPGEAP